MQLVSRIQVVCLLAIGLAVLAASACRRPTAAADAEPFRQAIGDYLRAKNMAMAVKEIKKGPTIENGSAQLSASLVHEQLGGPSVTWTFHFQRQADGKWVVLRQSRFAASP